MEKNIIASYRQQLNLNICTRTPDYLREVYFLKYFASILPVPRIIQVVQPEADICAPITYLRVEDMDHYVRRRPDIIEQSFEWLKHQL